MGEILKFFFMLLLIAVVLLLLVPIGWVVWKLIVLVFGGAIFVLGDILLFIIIVGGIIAIVKALFS